MKPPKPRNILPQTPSMILLMLLLFLGSCGEGMLVERTQQRAFERERMQFWKDYQAAPNEIKKSEIFNASRKASCEFIAKNGRTFFGWKGKLHQLTTFQGGGIVLRVVIRSEKNGLPVDYVHAMVSKEDSLYDKLAGLKEKQDLYFSFAFEEELEFFNVLECLDELSLTEEGSLRNPELSIVLKDVAGKKSKLKNNN